MKSEENITNLNPIKSHHPIRDFPAVVGGEATQESEMMAPQ